MNRHDVVTGDTPMNPPSQPTSEAETIPSTEDIRAVYLRQRNERSASSGATVPATSQPPTMVSRIRTSIQSRFRSNPRVTALGLLSAACALLIALSQSDVARSLMTLSGTTYRNAVERVASTASAALEVIGGRGAESAVPANDVASVSAKKVATVRPTGTQGPLYSSTTLQPMPLVTAATADAVGSAPIDGAEGSSLDGSAADASIIYSADDIDVSPPAAVRSPGLALDRVHGGGSASLIEILVSETGRVESATARHRPATVGAALETTTALSVVKTWRFLPARKNGHPVKYRTTVPVAQTMNPAGTRDGAR